jgi:hypothetical protein
VAAAKGLTPRPDNSVSYLGRHCFRHVEKAGFDAPLAGACRCETAVMPMLQVHEVPITMRQCLWQPSLMLLDSPHGVRVCRYEVVR